MKSDVARKVAGSYSVSVDPSKGGPRAGKGHTLTGGPLIIGCRFHHSTRIFPTPVVSSDRGGGRAGRRVEKDRSKMQLVVAVGVGDGVLLKAKGKQ